MVFTLGLRRTFRVWPRRLALVQSLTVQVSLASHRAVSKKTLRCTARLNVAQYPIEICSDTLATVLEDLSTETLARTDAVAWAQELLDAHGTAHPGCYSFGREHNDFCWTWQIVYGANYHERGYVSEIPPPYFYRSSDFAEWAARTRNVDPPLSEDTIFSVRPHQCPRTFGDVPAFGIAKSFDAFCERLGITVRSVDGLDLLDEYMLGSTIGTKYLLQSHLGSRLQPDYLEGYSVTLSCDADLESAISHIIDFLGFPMETVHRF